MSLQPQISTHHTSIPSPLPSSPSFNFHLTRMVNTLMIWVGTGLPTDTAGNSVGGAASMGSVEQVDNKLAGDWSVAMPSRGVGVVSWSMGVSGEMLILAGMGDMKEHTSDCDTPVQVWLNGYCSANVSATGSVISYAHALSILAWLGYSPCVSADTSLGIAKKFPLNQIHLSLSLPPSLTNQTGQSIDPYASKMMLVMEKKLGKWIEEILSQERT